VELKIVVCQSMDLRHCTRDDVGVVHAGFPIRYRSAGSGRIVHVSWSTIRLTSTLTALPART
jgi:hypothetical protein